MASSDSTGFHDIGWKFHQYSSSGGVLEASSESVLQMNDGASLKGNMTLNSSGQITIATGGELEVESGGVVQVESGGAIRDHSIQNLVGTHPATITNYGVTIIGTVATTSTVNYHMAAPVAGARKKIVIVGNSSSQVIVAASSATPAIMSQSSANVTATGTSGPFGLFSSSALAGGAFEINLSATGTGFWRIHGGLSETVVAATIAESTKLYATT